MAIEILRVINFLSVKKDARPKTPLVPAQCAFVRYDLTVKFRNLNTA